MNYTTTSINDEDGLNRLAENFEKAAEDYFNAYQRTCGPSAVIWLQNHETGRFMVFTRGEYADKISEQLKELVAYL